MSITLPKQRQDDNNHAHELSEGLPHQCCESFLTQQVTITKQPMSNLPGLSPFCLRCCSKALASTGCARGTPPAGLLGLVTGESTLCGARTMLLCTFVAMSDASSVGVAGASGIDIGSSTSTVAVDEPALLGMLKEGPQGLGLAAGELVKADAVLDTEAGVKVLFHSSICLNRASRSGNIFLGMVIVFLAALSYNKTV